MKQIDLHMHSTASDGTLSPSEIIDMAEELGLEAVALTDHDTVSGLKEFMLRAASSSVKAIPGVEIAALWKTKEVHILGLWINYESEELLKLLSEIRSNSPRVAFASKLSGFAFAPILFKKFANSRFVPNPITNISELSTNESERIAAEMSFRAESQSKNSR